MALVGNGGDTADLPPRGGDVRRDKGGQPRAPCVPALGIAAALLVTPALAAPPTVMSLNVCTDQLAMLLAAPGQLLSVSNLSADPSLSFLHDKAAAYPKNRGLAEEVFLARPDIVVSGTFSLHNTAALLKHLGFRVEQFDYSVTLDTIPRDIRRMGDIMGQKDKAERIASNFERERAGIEGKQCGRAPTLIAYEQNGVALGQGTLADSVIRAAGFRNLAAELGVSGMAPIPLELLVQKKPDVIVLPDKLGDTPSLADQAYRHPAIRELGGTVSGRFVPAGSWSCGGPFTLEAVKALSDLREKIAPCSGKEATQ